MLAENKKNVVVIGNGMVGHRFVEKLVEFDMAKQYRIVTFCEEPRAAYDRVGLTSFFAHREIEALGVHVHLNKATKEVTGDAIKYGDVQIAVYNFVSRGAWHACQNMCPHMNAFVLSRGIIGTAGQEPKVACPLHKKPFSLKTGQSLSGEPYSLKVFPVKVEDEEVYLELPPKEQLNALLSTAHHCIKSAGVGASGSTTCVSCARG